MAPAPGNNSGGSDIDGAVLLGAGLVVLALVVFAIVVSVLKSSPPPTPVPRPPLSPSPTPHAPAPRPPVPTPAPFALAPGTLTFGSISPSPPPPSPVVVQSRAPVPSPQSATPDSWMQDALDIISDIPGMLISDAAITNYIADLFLNGKNSLVWQLLEGGVNVLAKTAMVIDAIIEKIKDRLSARTTSGSLRKNFAKMALRAKARLGMAWGKQSALAGENIAARTASEMGATIDTASMARQVARNVAVAASTATRLTVGAVRASINMAAAIATDPLAVAGITGMVLDSKNVGNFAELSLTSDLNAERDNQTEELKNTTIDCTSYPIGPKCPIDSSAPPTPGPAPPPTQGRFPRFLGPHDLLDPDIFEVSTVQVQNMIANPADSDNTILETVVMLETLAAQTGNSSLNSAATNMRALYNSILSRAAGGTNSRVLIPFLWVCQTSQTTVSQAISAISSYISSTSSPGTAPMIYARLKVYLEVQTVTANFIASSMNNNLIPTARDLLTLVDTIVSSSALKDYIDALFDKDCVDRGGVVFDPGNGYDHHTCSWATKEDCHGAYPWLSQDGQITDPISPRVQSAICSTTCTVPTPCPPSPSPSPGSCTKKIECPAPSPCQALVDPSKTDLMYTEWRSKQWFLDHSSLVNPLDTNAIPPQGACINGTLGWHQFCDNIQKVGMCGDSNPFANNVYIRDQGTCVNSKHLCDIKGVGFSGGSPPGVNITPTDTCTVNNPNDIVSGYLVGDTITRFYNTNSEVCVPFVPIPHVDTGDGTLNTIINGGIDALNTIGSGGASFAGSVATAALDAAGALGSAAGSIAAEGPVDFTPLITDPSTLQQANGDPGAAAFLSGDSLNTRTAEYDGPGEIPESYWDGNCNWPFGCIRQRCPSSQVMINRGAGNYCYNKCSNGKSRGTTVLTVDYCDFRGSCDPAFGCVCPGNKVNGGPNDRDTQTGCGCQSGYFINSDGNCVEGIEQDPTDNDYMIYKGRQIANANTIFYDPNPATTASLKFTCKYMCDCVAFGTLGYFYGKNSPAPVSLGAGADRQDIYVMKPGVRERLGCPDAEADWEAEHCGPPPTCQPNQYITGRCTGPPLGNYPGSDYRTCSPCPPEPWSCNGVSLSIDSTSMRAKIRPPDYWIPHPYWPGWKIQFLVFYVRSDPVDYSRLPDDTGAVLWNNQLSYYNGFNYADQGNGFAQAAYQDYNNGQVFVYSSGPRSENGYYFRVMSVLVDPYNNINGLAGWQWWMDRALWTYALGDPSITGRWGVTRSDATIGYITSKLNDLANLVATTV